MSDDDNVSTSSSEANALEEIRLWQETMPRGNLTREERLQHAASIFTGIGTGNERRTSGVRPSRAAARNAPRTSTNSTARPPNHNQRRTSTTTTSRPVARSEPQEEPCECRVIIVVYMGCGKNERYYEPCAKARREENICENIRPPVVEEKPFACSDRCNGHV
ncbi:hypothetical protein EV356DRAFT_496161 [Viridothelium virens]|uniref:Uncharacterized protein n=1 Tax=Viridothelium virens TaxID=1048519 RepID=A0A6A6HHL0_VIRVR|nr:hypothetical protein EV356DRAFT_496161 [Viridothelium virens]